VRSVKTRKQACEVSRLLIHRRRYPVKNNNGVNNAQTRGACGGKGKGELARCANEGNRVNRESDTNYPSEVMKLASVNLF